MNRLYAWLYNGVSRHRRLACLLMTLVTLLAGAGVMQVQFDDTLDLMLPDDSAIQQAGQLLREADLAGKVVIWLHSTATGVTEEQLADQATRFSALLENSPLVSAMPGMDAQADMLEQVFFFCRAAAPFCEAG